VILATMEEFSQTKHSFINECRQNTSTSESDWIRVDYSTYALLNSSTSVNMNASKKIQLKKFAIALKGFYGYDCSDSPLQRLLLLTERNPTFL